MPEPGGSDVGLKTPGAPMRVLVVEGAEYAGGLLRESGDPSMLHIESARDPRQALRQLRNEFYHAVVVELPHPSMSAEDLFRSVVAFDVEQAVRIVFLANDLSDPATRRFLTDAGQPFLTRPVDANELQDMVLRVALGARQDDFELEEE